MLLEDKRMLNAMPILESLIPSMYCHTPACAVLTPNDSPCIFLIYFLHPPDIGFSVKLTDDNDII